MADQKLISKLANIPLAKPGYDTLGMSAPVIVQMNPQGRWENTKPENLDEDRLKSVIQHLVNSKAISAAQSYCCQCAADNHQTKGNQQYIPVVMMPIYPADQCPFDMDCEIQKMKETDKPKPSKKTKSPAVVKDDDKEKEKRKVKKRGFVMQRLTDFDLLSQW